MRTRHRIPTLFTLSMMDVFCCALGCVILLWLWNERVARQKAQAMDETSYQLDKTRDELIAARGQIETLESDLANVRGSAAALAADLKSTRTDLAGARGQVAGLTTQRAQLQEELDSANKQLAARAADLKEMRSRVADEEKAGRKLAADAASRLAKKQAEYDEAADLLAKRQKEQDRLSALLETSRKRTADLETLSRDKEERLALASKRAEDLEDKLHDAEARLKQLKTTVDVVPGLRSDLDLTARKLAAAEARSRDLERDLTLRRAAMLDVQGQLEEARNDKKKSDDQFARFRAAADNRFAGIQLTGRRVVLLVDMSGSMKSVEENIPAPEKWPAVAATAEKVLRSLPDLEKFQLIMFSEDASYPLGSPGQWIDYDPVTSGTKVRQAILNVVPQGNTNLYLPFEQAFTHFRSKGLDAVYLFSDGLPNVGPGLSPTEQARNLTEEQRGAIMGKYLRGVLKTKWNRFEVNREKVRINSVGFFYDSPDVGAFLWALSRENEGSFVGMSKP